MTKGKKAGAPVSGAKDAARPAIKEALGKALENRAKQLGIDVKNVTGFGMKDVPPAADKVPPPGTQGFLFGEGDKIRAALSSELVIINAEIGAAEKSKVNINEKIDSLSARRRVVEDAMNALDKVKENKKPDEKKKGKSEPKKGKKGS